MYKLEVFSSLKWYFESKNLSLSNAIQLRAPLSVESQKNLRLYYSQYFSSLISATELLLDKTYPYKMQFRDLLYASFVFDGAMSGESNYLYIKELRNSIEHRGWDVTSSCHFNDGFPYLIAPLKIRDKFGKNEYSTFCFYLIEIINKCEMSIGHIVAQHLEEFGNKLKVLTNDELAYQVKQFLMDSVAVPDFVKVQALAFIDSQDFLKTQNNNTQEILGLLRGSALPSDFSKLIGLS